MSELSITPANVLPSSGANIFPMIQTSTEVTAGDFVGFGATPPNLIAKVFAGSPPSHSTSGSIRGIALNHGYSGQYVAVATQDAAFVIGATLVKGETYWSSATNPGKIIPTSDLTAGDYRIQVGVAASTSVLVLNPTTTAETG